jgi:hypothetical protein
MLGAIPEFAGGSEKTTKCSVRFFLHCMHPVVLSNEATTEK